MPPSKYNRSLLLLVEVCLKMFPASSLIISPPLYWPSSTELNWAQMMDASWCQQQPRKLRPRILFNLQQSNYQSIKNQIYLLNWKQECNMTPRRTPQIKIIHQWVSATLRLREELKSGGRGVGGVDLANADWKKIYSHCRASGCLSRNNRMCFSGTHGK